jgi:S1 RNA binding domain/Zc3h12a-like Ribonuclease NYN domain
MTKAPSRGARHHEDDGDLVVVDGSNIATEGRSMPSLSQLNDAVLSFREEFPDVNVTVVVDATFGHRIAKSEVAEFDAAVAHNELVAPPAGAVGRGDAFVLSIANKSGARILSNDSFQEFHGTYPWLFDEGRLVGGKPVPHVGWVFVNRLPVKGSVSRKARAATAAEKVPARRSASKLASQPMPVPAVAPPGPARSAKGKPAAKERDVTPAPAARAEKAAAPRGGPVNELLPFLDFIQHHPVGSSVSGVVESYSSHGAYVTIGDVRGYVPLRLMGSPPPRSAREVMKQGEMVTFVVDSFAPSRRNVDLALPGVARPAEQAPQEEPAPPPKRKRGAPAVSVDQAPVSAAAGRARKAAAPASVESAAAPPTRKRPAGKKSAAPAKKASPSTTASAPAKKAAAPAKKTAATKKATAPTKKAAATKTTAAKKRGEKQPVNAVPADAGEPADATSARSGRTRRKATSPS